MIIGIASLVIELREHIDCPVSERARTQAVVDSRVNAHKVVLGFNKISKPAFLGLFLYTLPVP